jgi:PAS domain S-box-containing protein
LQHGNKRNSWRHKPVSRGYSHVGQLWSNLANVVAGDAAGDFVVAPLLILWAGPPKPTIERRDVVHATLLITCLFLVSVIVFGGKLPWSRKGYALEFLCIPVLIWAAFRFGPRGAATTSLPLATIALSATLWGFGPFVTPSINESLLLLQTYIGVSTVMALAVAAVVWDREQVRQQLLRQASELRLVIDGMPGLVSYVDRKFRYRFLNRRYAEWFGRPTEGLVNKTVAESFGAVLFENIRPYAERALAGEVVTFEQSHSYQGDRLRRVRATYVPDQAEDGLVRGFVVVVEDITEQHQSQESQKALELTTHAVDRSLQYTSGIARISGSATKHPCDGEAFCRSRGICSVDENRRFP